MHVTNLSQTVGPYRAEAYLFTKERPHPSAVLPDEEGVLITAPHVGTTLPYQPPIGLTYYAREGGRDKTTVGMYVHDGSTVTFTEGSSVSLTREQVIPRCVALLSSAVPVFRREFPHTPIPLEHLIEALERLVPHDTI